MRRDRVGRMGASARRRLRTASLLRSAAIGLVAAVCLAACATTTTSTTTTTKVPVTTTTLPSVKVSKAEIAKAYETLFDLRNPAIAPKLAAVQEGSSLKAAITKAIRSSLASEAAGASIVSIKIEQGAACTKEFLPSPCAAVVYDILGPNGKPVLSNSAGGAVYISAEWLVAKSTICSLLSLENAGVPPAGC